MNADYLSFYLILIDVSHPGGHAVLREGVHDPVEKERVLRGQVVPRGGKRLGKGLSTSEGRMQPSRLRSRVNLGIVGGRIYSVSEISRNVLQTWQHFCKCP